ncbi:MAG: DUF4097 domain-containing protein [Vallitalea sp.]|nr:DUF4097 domain-containing protein [Vallitalea sp.]
MKYNNIMKKLAKIFTITLISSFIGIIIYLSINKIPFINFRNSYVHHNINIPNISNNSNKVPDTFTDTFLTTVAQTFKNSSPMNNEYDKISDTITKTFSRDAKTIDISCSSATLDFIIEDRDDIKVEYSYTKPDTPKYKVIYDTTYKNNTIKVTQSIKTLNFAGNISSDKYNNDITIYVPTDYTADTLIIKNSLGDINNSDFYNNVSNIDFYASLGNINIKFNSPKNLVTLDSSLGDISLNNNSTIKQLNVKASSGSINITSTGEINDVIATDSMGDIDLESTEKINTCKLFASMGDIKAYFKKPIDKFNIRSNMGDIDMKLPKDQDINIYAKTSMGDIKSTFPILKDDETKNIYYLYCSMGDIDIKEY